MQLLSITVIYSAMGTGNYSSCLLCSLVRVNHPLLLPASPPTPQALITTVAAPFSEISFLDLTYVRTSDIYLISLSTLSSVFTHAIANDRISFFLNDWIRFYYVNRPQKKCDCFKTVIMYQMQTYCQGNVFDSWASGLLPAELCRKQPSLTMLPYWILTSCHLECQVFKEQSKLRNLLLWSSFSGS